MVNLEKIAVLLLEHFVQPLLFLLQELLPFFSGPDVGVFLLESLSLLSRSPSYEEKDYTTYDKDDGDVHDLIVF